MVSYLHLDSRAYSMLIMLILTALHRKGVEASAEYRYACNLALDLRDGRYL